MSLPAQPTGFAILGHEPTFTPGGGLADAIAVSCGAVSGATSYVWTTSEGSPAPGLFGATTPGPLNFYVLGFGTKLSASGTITVAAVNATGTGPASAALAIQGASKTALSTTQVSALSLPTITGISAPGALATVTFNFSTTNSVEALIGFRFTATQSVPSGSPSEVTLFLNPVLNSNNLAVGSAIGTGITASVLLSPSINYNVYTVSEGTVGVVNPTTGAVTYGVSVTKQSLYGNITTGAATYYIITPTAGTSYSAYVGVATVAGAPVVLVASNGTIASVVSSGLPTGMTSGFTGNNWALYGTPTTAGVFSCSVTLTGPGSVTSTVAFTVTVIQPVINLKSENLTASVGVTYSHQLLFTVVGQIAPPSTFTLVGAPSWLSVSGAGVLGASPVFGNYSFSVTASNGTQSSTVSYQLSVAALQITSSPLISVAVGRPVSFALTANITPGLTWASLNLPSWLTLLVNTITGTAPSSVESDSAQVSVTSGDSIATQLLDIEVVDIMNGAAEVDCWESEPIYTIYDFNASTLVVDNFTISGQPPGITITQSPYNGSLAIVSGAASAFGIFEATISANAHDTLGVSAIYEKQVTFLVSGGLFLNWFHNVPLQYDLQVLTRSLAVESYYFTSDTEGLWMKRADHVKLYVIFRNGPTSTNNNGKTIIDPTTFTLLSMTIRPVNDYDAEPLIEISAAPTLATIGTNTVAVFEFDVTSDPIERKFFELDQSPADSTDEIALDCMAEITWTDASGTARTTRNFNVTIAQDIDQ